jgi:amidase
MSAIALGRLVQEGWASSRMVTEAHLNRIAATDPSAVTVVEVFGDAALAAADAADQAVRAGSRSSVLRGVPFTIRHNTDSSASSEGAAAGAARPACDEPPLDRLRRHGAIAVGQTRSPDRGFRWGNDLASDTVVEPGDGNRVAGCSGDATAVAAGMTPLAVGDDDGGSLRLAAQAQGVSCLRLTCGRVATGSSSLAEPSLALQLFTVPGFTARRVPDLAAALQAAAGSSDGDPRIRPVPLHGPPWPHRVAVISDAGEAADAHLAQGIRRAADALADAGYQVDEAKVPNVEEAASTWAALVAAEGRLNPVFWYQRISPDAQACDDDAHQVDGIDHQRYAKALTQQRAQALAWARLQRQYPIILGPVATVAPHAAQAASSTGVETEQTQAAGLVAAFSLIDLPVVVMPVTTASGPPQAVQVAAPRWRDDIALAAAQEIEQRLPPTAHAIRHARV